MTAEYSTSMQEEAAKIAAIEESAPSEKVAKAAEELSDLLEQQRVTRYGAQEAYRRAMDKANVSIVARDAAALCKTGSEEEKECKFVEASCAHQSALWIGVSNRSTDRADKLGSDIRAAKAYLDVLMSQDDVTPEADDKTPLDPQERDMIDASK